MTASTATPAIPGRAAPRTFLLGPWFPILLAALCYLHTLGGGFTYDDNSIVRDNPLIRSLTDWKSIWLRDWWYAQGEQSGGLTDPSRDRLYRPLTIFSFALNYALHGLHPAGFHAVNIALHAAVCGLVWLFARRLCDDPLLAAIAATIFAVHPIHAEPVAGIVGRAEILAALFILLGLIALMPRTGVLNTGRAVLAALAMFAALLAKETAVCFPALALLVIWWRQRPSASRDWRGLLILTLAIVLALAAYFALRYIALEHRFVRTSVPNPMLNPLVDAAGVSRWLLPFTILGHYTRLMLAPANLSCDYGLAIIDPAAGVTPITLLGMAAAAAIIAAALRPTRLIGLLALLFLASYALISNTFILIGVSLAERLFYLPSVPVTLAIALGFRALWTHISVRGPESGAIRIARLLAIAAVLALALRSAARAVDWASDEQLFAADQRNWPPGVHLATVRAQLLIAQAEELPPGAARNQALAEANAMLLGVLERVPRHSGAFRLLGLVNAHAGNIPEAIRYFEMAVTLSPEDRLSQRWLVELRGQTADSQRRVADLERLIQENPRDIASRIALGTLFLELARNVDALRQFEAAREIDPSNIEVLRGLGQALAVNLQNDQAATVFRDLLKIAPDDWIAHANLALLLAETDPPAALRHAERAFELQPDDFRTRLNLAAALAINGRIDDALARYREALAQLPPEDSRRALINDRIRELTENRP